MLVGSGLGLSGMAAGMAGTHGLWLALSGALLLLVWLLAANLLLAKQHPVVPAVTPGAPDEAQIAHHLLLDASPTPLVLVAGRTVRTMNRAARRLFATDDRILPPPTPLFDRDATHLRHAGRNWRTDRVEVGDRSVVALIDIESEERTAEACASAEMIQVLGHEMLNGLVPIVSLAECGIVAAEARDENPGLLTEILTTLARRAEGLRRFTEAYRELARLPLPLRLIVSVEDMLNDLARLFASRWPDVRLSVDIEPGLWVEIDRDQMNQACWALLQNAVEAIELGDASSGMIDIRASMDDNVLTIEIRDNGPGVPPDRVRGIFRPFYTSKPSGSGIGLSLARQVMQAHGGTLTLISPSPAIFRARVPRACTSNDGVLADRV
ncbi:HAMP domain-containing sensor histidine kinase [Sphingomonas sp. CFBP8993]|uniref:sensor histidine kinase n=1 Tax=Sphingomonas sp. CFBP8993 TaxID=3096526 RepID=UPI002A69A9CF|nr:HAMP domain-containing sensor histidine kinase [Sphingomonas sp. CFBP8993]MDY0960475.1 HAMP domain-containing sensor histidine kinase [Sphingomonas sp. CFBP8993]